MWRLSRINLLVILMSFILLFGSYHSGHILPYPDQGDVTCNSFALTASVGSVTILFPAAEDGYSREVNVSWIISNRSVNETYTSEVLVSKDSGETYQLLNVNINTTRMWYMWDSSGFLVRDIYSVMVRAYDSSGWNSTGISPLFTAGGIILTGTTPRESTNSDLYTLQRIIDGFLYGAFVGSIVVTVMCAIFLVFIIPEKKWGMKK